MSYVQNTDRDRKMMLDSIGVSSLDDLLEPVPEQFRVRGDLELPGGISESEVVDRFDQIASANRPASSMASFLGGGIYDRIIPAAVRFILSRNEFYTSYTPYQAEVSQGTLQAIYEYQSMICGLTGMEVANASLYDGATALAESILMACSVKRKNRVLLPSSLPGRIKSVLKSYSAGRGIELEYLPFTEEGTIDTGVLKKSLGPEVAGVVMAQPNYFGVVEDAEEISSLVGGSKSLLIAYVEPVSLALLTPPGEYGADIAVGEGQSLGLPQNFGGPLIGFIAAKEKYVRKCPGRLISSTVDVDGRRGYVMTLQTREQHIRREKATSNICTNEGLCALAAAVYLSTLGEEGFREVALQSASKCRTLFDMLTEIPGFKPVFSGDFFQEFVLDLPVKVSDFMEGCRRRGLLPGIPLGNDFPGLGDSALLVSVTERRKREELELYRELAEELGGGR
ncbi:MAG: aminomethyl-transferring glycine dehydrogenase subunit GcvPA [Candidatus Latescibacteria bacterium]|nr:aminomethyl-transferring glycine dehydrogenase subunit GcvPA [bacterium]MBD3424407.1 aminomethyl-transferring glycine dehydrogenase subunit GcvPA [Candidatus Latescibacterota bacterium]